MVVASKGSPRKKRCAIIICNAMDASEATTSSSSAPKLASYHAGCPTVNSRDILQKRRTAAIDCWSSHPHVHAYLTSPAYLASQANVGQRAVAAIAAHHLAGGRSRRHHAMWHGMV